MRRICQVITATFFALAAQETWAAAGADADFETLAGRYTDEFAALSPVRATGLGDHRFDDWLDQIGQRARQRRTRWAEAFLAGC